MTALTLATATPRAALSRLLAHVVVRRVLQALAVVLVIRYGTELLLGQAPTLGIVLDGAVKGSLSSLIAMGLILVYRATGIVNFGQASMGSVPAVAGLLLYTTGRVPFVAAIAVMLVGAPLVGLAVNAVVLRFSASPRLIATVATLGIAQLLAFFELLLPLVLVDGAALNTTVTTPLSGYRTTVSTVVFTGDYWLAIGVVAVVLIGLGSFLRFTRIGMAIRASAENADRALLLGIPVRRVAAVVWVIAALLSALGVFLRAPLVGLPFGTLLSYSVLLYALTAAVIAGMESLPVAFVAGVVIGVIDTSAFFATGSDTASVALLLPITLVALLLRRSKGRAGDTGVSSFRAVREHRPIPVALRRLPEVRIARLAVLAVAVGVAALLPGLAGAGRPDFASLSVVYAILGVSLVVLTGWAGQISLGQFGFAALGALVAGQLAANHGVDFFVTLAAAGSAGALVAVVIGIPALRISGPFLAVVTLAFAAFTTNYLLQPDKASWLFPALEGPVARPVLWGAVDVSSPGRFYVVCLVVLGLCLLAARSLRRSRSGRLLLAVRDNPRAAQAYGVSLARAKLTAFAVSGFIAAVGGALLSYVLGTVDPSGFPIGISIGVFAMAVIGGLTSLPGTLLGALYYTGFLYLVADGRFSTLATGVGLTLLLLFFPGGLAQLAYSGRDAFVRWAARRHGVVDAPLPLDDTPLQRRPVEDDRPLQEAAP